jgi:hypothetical protein
MLTEVPLLAERVAELSDGLQSAGYETKWNELNAVQKNLMRANYHVYWLRRENTTHILVDTNNLILNLDTGKGSILEDFKRAHRYLDVAKAAQEVERRRKLVETGNLAQPEVERVIITHGDPGEVAAITAGFVGAAGSGGVSKIEKVEISTTPGESTP